MSDGVNEVGFSGDATGTYVRNGVVEAPRADDGEGTCSVCQGLCTEVDGREGKYYYCDRSTQVAVRSTFQRSGILSLYASTSKY